MKISVLVERLLEIKAAAGDLEVGLMERQEDDYYARSQIAIAHVEMVRDDENPEITRVVVDS